eukprot:TRINITY_DN66735_c0_g1_i1.p1 TRINITY_DN66735_c0_g1~~TRINITY_DN66735_c0_g1_i1.p1  ORF type:complete len:390 (-),score=87.65 TRINITY_DN66735_c0_g1_i1:1260-2429(-)
MAEPSGDNSSTGQNEGAARQLVGAKRKDRPHAEDADEHEAKRQKSGAVTGTPTRAPTTLSHPTPSSMPHPVTAAELLGRSACQQCLKLKDSRSQPIRVHAVVIAPNLARALMFNRTVEPNVVCRAGASDGRSSSQLGYALCTNCALRYKRIEKNPERTMATLSMHMMRTQIRQVATRRVLETLTEDNLIHSVARHVIAQLRSTGFAVLPREVVVRGEKKSTKNVKSKVVFDWLVRLIRRHVHVLLGVDNADAILSRQGVQDGGAAGGEHVRQEHQTSPQQVPSPMDNTPPCRVTRSSSSSSSRSSSSAASPPPSASPKSSSQVPSVRQQAQEDAFYPPVARRVFGAVGFEYDAATSEYVLPLQVHCELGRRSATDGYSISVERSVARLI